MLNEEKSPPWGVSKTENGWAAMWACFLGGSNFSRPSPPGDDFPRIFAGLRNQLVHGRTTSGASVQASWLGKQTPTWNIIRGPRAKTAKWQGRKCRLISSLKQWRKACLDVTLLNSLVLSGLLATQNRKGTGMPLKACLFPGIWCSAARTQTIGSSLLVCSRFFTFPTRPSLPPPWIALAKRRPH